MEFLSDVEYFWVWLILAALLAIGEIAIAPGIFMIFIAVAALGMGIITSMIDLSLTAQLMMFALLSIASVYLAKHYYKESNVRNEDPLLNDRSARMIGQNVTIVKNVSSSGGRVKVGDTEWPARRASDGAEMKTGAKAVIVSVDAGILQVDPES